LKKSNYAAISDIRNVRKTIDTASEELAVRRGRPTEFTNAQLRNRRDQLAQDFDAAWPEIGWELSRCEKLGNVSKIFDSVLSKHKEDLFSIFRRPSEEPADFVKLRKLRSERRYLAPPSYVAEESKRRAHSQLLQADWALAENSKRRRIIKRERKRRRKAASQVEQEYRGLSDKQRLINQQIRALEPSVARRELFRFIRSKRYELTPISLANAMANVPYSGWRQSMRRCEQFPSYLGNGPIHQLFKAIRYLVTKASKRTESALLKDIHAGIPSLPSRYKIVKVKLAHHWFYVERAIRRAYRTNPNLSAIPFKITFQYLRQLQSPTQEEALLAEGAKIKLSGRKGSPIRLPQKN
jgi:hypothetical protein